MPALSRLCRLVESLTPAQKADFRKYLHFLGELRRGESAKSGEKSIAEQNLLVFDAINHCILNAKPWEEMLKYLDKKYPHNRDRLYERIAALYDAILESLRRSPDQGARLARLNGLMQDINTLYHKDLYDDCQHLMAEAHKLAEQLDKPTYLLELLNWEKHLGAPKTERTKVQEQRQEMENRENSLIGQIQQASVYHFTAWLISAENRRVGAPIEVVKDEALLKMFQLDLDTALKRISSPRARIFYLQCLRTHGSVAAKSEVSRQDYWHDKMFETQEKIIQYYQGEYSVLASEEPLNYSKVLENHITTCLMLNKTDRAAELLKLLEAVVKDKTVMFYHRLNWFITSGNKSDIQEAQRYIENQKIREKLAENAPKMRKTRLITVQYQCGLVYFSLGNWEAAHQWFLDALGGQRPDAHHLAATLSDLLDILCQYEMNAYGGSPARLFDLFADRQTRAGQMTKLIQDLVILLKNYVNKVHVESDALRLSALKSELTSSKLSGNYGVVLAWLEAKQNNTAFLDELKKYNQP